MLTTADIYLPDLSQEWPQLLSMDERVAIAKDFYDATSPAALASEECSFCGKAELSCRVRRFPIDQVDISILEDSVDILRNRWNVGTALASFKSATINDHKYSVCENCATCIRRKKFIKAPLYSYANGCWTGEVPAQLQGLTFMEEQCIALARATRCMYKLKQGGEFRQTAASGNVCIFAQDPRILVEILPPPINDLYDEVAVVFLKSSHEVVKLEVSYDRTAL